MNILSNFFSVYCCCKKILQELSYVVQNMDSVFEHHFFWNSIICFPCVSSQSFSVVTNIPKIEIDQFVMEKYGLDFFQLCDKLRIEHFLNKRKIDFSENSFCNFSLKGTGFTNRNEFNNAMNL